MSRISMVAAVAKNGVIGREGGLPWHIPSDLKRFRQITMGKPVIMGRKTWESLPKRPLPGRRNIVITRQAGYVAMGAEIARSAGEALALCSLEPQISIIGGGDIYKLFWPLAHRLYVSEVDMEAEGDTHFPHIDAAEWEEAVNEAQPRGPGDSAAYRFRVFNRISPPQPS